MVTGAAGFIGFHVSKRLLERGDEVLGVDNLNAYYDVALKEARLAQIKDHPGFSFLKIDLVDREAVAKLFVDHAVDGVINLAAQAGVRHSLTHPQDYIDSNLVGFANVLEGCRHQKVNHLVYASSSSVYGSNKTLPFSVSDTVDHPVSLYAATKKANELMAHTYSHLFNLPTTGLRFFTVYGPWGRPDMAYYSFTKAILEDQPIDVYNAGKMRRDFTYVDDVVEGVVRVLNNIPSPDPSGSSAAPYRVYNIGNNKSVELGDFITVLEKGLGKTAKKNLLPMQPGDLEETCADVGALMRDVGFSPSTPIEVGLTRFMDWYREYHKC